MSATVKAIGEFIEELAPVSLAEEWDNVGLLVGKSKRKVGRVLLALDATPEVIDEAINKECQMIITHHPITRGGLKSVTDADITGKKLLDLIENKIALYSAHTNLDKADGGVNDCLCSIFELKDVEIPKDKNGNNGLMRIGYLKQPLKLGEAAGKIKEKLRLPYLPIVGDHEKVISKIAVCGGNGMSLLAEAIKSGADLYVTGDVKYHDANYALESGICMLDLSHYGSEVVVLHSLKDYLLQKRNEHNLMLEIIISDIDAQPFSILE